jgi:hypothetical protein
MKPLFQINRYALVMSAAGGSRAFLLTPVSQTGLYHFRRLRRRPGTARQPFHALSRDYFAREAHHHFAIEATVFCLLLLTTVLPLLNGAKAILDLVQSGGGLSGL